MRVREDPAPRPAVVPGGERPAATLGDRTSRRRSGWVPAIAGRPIEWALDHPLLASFAVAIAFRVAFAVAITVFRGGTLFLDDQSYSELAKAVAAHGLGPLDYNTHVLFRQTGGLLGPVSLLYRVFGPVELAGQLYVALVGALLAPLVARLVLEVASRPWALAAGLTVAVLPSQILWSSLILKDALVWTVLAAVAVAVAIAARSTGRRLAVLGLVIAAGVVALGYLRLYTVEIALIALVLASLFSDRQGRALRVAGAIVLLLCVPVRFDIGVGGEWLVRHGRPPGEQRALNATGNTKVAAAAAAAPAENGVNGEVRYLPQGMTVVALRPWPWEAASSGDSTGLWLARLETVVWYPLVALALVGLTTVWRRRRALAFPFFAAGGALIVYALSEGNLGTAYRHRGELVWVVVVFGVLGVQRLVEWRTGRRAAVP